MSLKGTAVMLLLLGGGYALWMYGAGAQDVDFVFWGRAAFYASFGFALCGAGGGVFMRVFEEDDEV